MFSIGFSVERSETIQRDVSDVYSSLANFNEWPHWSPWLCQEPDCPVIVDGAPGTLGHRQEWNGTFIGSGNMRLESTTENESLDYELNFLKPWKMTSRVGFNLSPAADGTKVTWWMDGKLPLFLFFMKKKMDGFVGSDYQRGLSMFKEYLEDGEVLTYTSVEGVNERPGFHYFGRRRTCALSDIGDAMRNDLAELSGMVDAGTLDKPVNILSIYHDFDMGNQVCDYTTGFAYGASQEPRDGFVTGELPGHKALLVRHNGPYRHVGNAWAAAMGYVRANHKINKSVPMYEIYSNDPHQAEESDVETEVYVPVKR